MTRHTLAPAALVLFLAAAGPALADSQSSNSSSNCSNGRCTRVETYDVEDRHGSYGWTRVETWDEQPRRRSRPPPVVIVLPPRDDDDED
ncbi:hypothetical protein [Inquilinus sp. CA228]|uniref:hypothetical protein n=1 Tax=Inquilinus sp. CA228 TaxID=3455609 RepID=UPI003F8D5309